RLGRSDEAATHYRLIVQRRRDHLGALRGLRDLAAEGGRWREALDAQQRVLGAVGSTERSPETEWLAAIYYELGRAEVARANAGGALAHFKSASRADRFFLPAALALGDAYELTGDHREAVRTWERPPESHDRPLSFGDRPGARRSGAGGRPRAGLPRAGDARRGRGSVREGGSAR